MCIRDRFTAFRRHGEAPPPAGPAPYSAGCPTCEEHKAAAWVRGLDEDSGCFYWWNSLSHESVWEEAQQEQQPEQQPAEEDPEAECGVQFNADWVERFVKTDSRRRRRNREQKQWLRENQRVTPKAAAQAAIAAGRGSDLSPEMMRAMYGESAPAIEAAEASLNLVFDKLCDGKKLVLWPVAV
eukprot:TRINITY_DN25200_c0_g1_i1.p1 TRINITY_DN25200_c0_g1~~TRINITY_DN25200_c0_g1_i1.p1  ORF type:complete len:183 (-),score=48.61 TRINITY_DN25200_c0_g1_i1:330-878(-)